MVNFIALLFLRWIDEKPVGDWVSLILLFLVGYEGYSLCLTHAWCLCHIFFFDVFSNYLYFVFFIFFSRNRDRLSHLPIRCTATVAEGSSNSIWCRMLTPFFFILFDFLKGLEAVTWVWIWGMREVLFEIVFINFLQRLWTFKRIVRNGTASLIKLWDYIGLRSTLICKATEFFANLFLVLHILNLFELLLLIFLLL